MNYTQNNTLDRDREEQAEREDKQSVLVGILCMMIVSMVLLMTAKDHIENEEAEQQGLVLMQKRIIDLSPDPVIAAYAKEQGE